MLYFHYSYHNKYLWFIREIFAHIFTPIWSPAISHLARSPPPSARQGEFTPRQEASRRTLRTALSSLFHTRWLRPPRLARLQTEDCYCKLAVKSMSHYTIYTLCLGSFFCCSSGLKILSKCYKEKKRSCFRRLFRVRVSS